MKIRLEKHFSYKLKQMGLMLGLCLGIYFLNSCASSNRESGTTTEAYEKPSDESYAVVEDLDTLEMEPSMDMERNAEMRQEKTQKVLDDAEKAYDSLNNENQTAAEQIFENPFQNAEKQNKTTFSIDVDNASYSNIRQLLSYGQTPPPGAVRIEEMINYFSYDYPNPSGEHPFSINTELATCPWNPNHQLVHIGLQGKKLNYEELKPSNLVFLVDASGSMEAENKLPLLQKSLAMLLDELGERDRVAIVAYAGAAGLVLPSTPATQKNKILQALNSLSAGGSTAGGQGIELAYRIAKENLIQGGNNRVILATDGDFNVGVSSDDALVALIEEKRKNDIFLTICGFGMGNYKDQKMESISNAGNGNYFYIDTPREAKKVFVKEMRANMFTIAKDVKIQLEFNPQRVKAYRLIGYENRVLENKDFDDDKKDAGELGAGHSVTALYEIIPAGEENIQASAQGGKLQPITPAGDLMKFRLRYKPPQSETSTLIEQVVRGEVRSLEGSSNNFRFSAAVAEFGLLLRKSRYRASASFQQVDQLAKSALGKDEEGYRQEFIELVKQAQ